MVCPNCKHELNPLARVCPTCGTPVPGAQPAAAGGQTVPAGPMPAPRKSYVNAWRVFTVILCIVAIAMNGALIAFWFLESIRVTGGVAENSAASVTLYSLYEICRKPAPYMTYIVVGACAISIVALIFPLFRKPAARRRFFVPKLMAVVCAVCYAVPYFVARMAYSIQAMLDGGKVDHSNPFTTICFGLLIVLFVAGELTSRNRYVVQRTQIGDLQAQLKAAGIKPNVE